MKKGIRIFICIACVAGIAITSCFAGYKMGYNRSEQDIDQAGFNKQTFYAKIEAIDGNNLVVQGLEVNDINFRGRFQFTIQDTTKLEWRYTDIELADLSVGDNISVTFSGLIMEISPAIINDVNKIQILDDKFQ